MGFIPEEKGGEIADYSYNYDKNGTTVKGVSVFYYGTTGRAENASEGGLEIYFPEEMQIGERLKLKLFFSSSETELNTIEALAEVVWIDILSGDGEFRSGVKFVDISPEDLVRLKDFLDSLTR